MTATRRQYRPEELRLLCRSGSYSGQTAGVVDGYVQANLAILPLEFAFEFLLFCQRNPRPCPLVEVLEPGLVAPKCAPNADLRTDLPGYRVFRNGQLVEEVGDIRNYWRADLVSFLIGCSFSFEEALMHGGIRLRHVDLGRNVAMYRTKRLCEPAGRFHGPMVVSMRPIPMHQVELARTITAEFPGSHGAPVHVGDPASLGIVNLEKPDYGDAVPILDGEVPVFWACGVTPQAVALESKPPFCITHAPGKMFVSDLRAAGSGGASPNR
ncbi:MAG: putative hydro-lyase [Proteobacteria bacterium]|nr:putative hydro-lyase [Pseudomonadota bacterium]